MPRRPLLGVVALMVGVAAWPAERRATAQAMLADDVIILSKGQRANEKARTETQLGVIPGAGAVPFRFDPGGGARFLERPGDPGSLAFPRSPAPQGVLSAASRPVTSRLTFLPITPVAAPAMRQPAPIYGTLELPEGIDEGPTDGLTIDQAIERLVRCNYDLRTKYQEIPQARADVLSAGLRANPILFASADNVPYGSYSTRRPGQVNYGITLVQPIDVNGKRKNRVLVAEATHRVIEASYQNAVRLGIDRLYTAYVDVLEAREAVRAQRATIAGLVALGRSTEALWRNGVVPHSDVDSVSIQRETAEAGLVQAESSLLQARRALATLLAIPADRADGLDVRGTIRKLGPPPRPSIRSSGSRSAPAPTWPPTGSASFAPRPTSSWRAPRPSRTSSCSMGPTTT
ncbi:MAG TPA: TolC family protein [Isosphaeraceae bacterium]|jgi:cobalt-zinc-cadmium efflux system outer membrane protein|nr:TolC family protein [Isosphaeraceae bacterium]